MADSLAQDILKLSASAFSKFMPFYQLSQDICEQMYPERASYTTTIDFEDFAGYLYDGYPTRARENLGNSIDAMLRQGNWFEVGTGDEDRDNKPANKVALNRATARIRDMIRHPRSGWMDAIKEGDMDWVTAGVSVESVEESSTRDYVVFRAWHPGNCAWVLNADRQVDMFFRKTMIGVREIVRRIDSPFGWNGTASLALRNQAKVDPASDIPVMHVLMRADDLYAGDAAAQQKNRHPFVSCYIDVANGVFLNQRGSPVFNYVVSRARSLSTLPFGFSPMALAALPDARMLQDMKLVIIEQGQKAVDPPSIGATNAFQRDMNFYAGGHTEADITPGQKVSDVFTTIDTGERINVGLELLQDVKTGITEAFLLNRLMLPTLTNMREVEVMVRTEEFRRAALPFFQPIEKNRHEPLLSTAWQVGVNMGIVSPQMFPQELRGQATSFTFDSPLNEAEGKLLVDRYFTTLNIATSAAKIDQTTVNLLDIRKATEEALVAGGKAEWVVTDGPARAQADKQADVVSGVTQGSDVVAKAAGAASDLANAALANQQAGLTGGAPGQPGA